MNPEIRLQPINKANSESFDSFAPAHADPPEEGLPIYVAGVPAAPFSSRLALFAGVP